MAMQTRIKICGLTRPEDARAAAQVGADAIGLVFYAPSPRAVSVAQARAVAAALPPFVTVVGLFVDAQPEAVREAMHAVPLDLLQFHGDESPDYCAQFGRPWLKAVRMRDEVDVAAEAVRYGGARGLLLDAYRPGVPGGTGERFEWSRVPHDLDMPLVLAGGLTPDNVAAAVTQVRPYAVDVSGGVEAAKGIKDLEKMAAFAAAVREADAAHD
jgi:phosphoribosylanthranilate isomerase